MYLAEQTVDISPTVGLEVLDVSNPRRRALAGTATMWGGALAVAVSGSHAYVAAGDGLRVYSLDDPAHPELVAGAELTRGWMADVAIAGQYAYVADGFRGLGVYDIGNPVAPANVTWVPISSRYPLSDAAVKAARGYAYVVFDDRLLIFDLASPGAPSQIGTSQKLRPGYAGRIDVVVRGDQAYVVIGDGLAVVDIGEPASPSLVAQADVAEGSIVLAEGGYVHLPAANGLHVFDVSTPAALAEVARLEPTGLSLGAMLGAHLLCLRHGRELIAFDVAAPASPVVAWSHDLELEVTATGLSELRGLLYILTAGEGVRIVDARDPDAISVVGTIEDPGYGFAVDFSGDYAYVVHGDGFQVVDVSDPSEPVVVNAEEAPG